MGTRLIGHGLCLESDDPCLWNLTHPEVVLSIHGLDLAAGAQAVVTNTFGANERGLARLGCGSDRTVAAINRAAVVLARRAAGPDRLVIGGLGPTAADGGAAAAQAMLLIDAGVDALLFETHRMDQALGALEQIERQNPGGRGVPHLISLVCWPDPAGPAVRQFADRGAAALGGNCQNGMSVALELAERLRAETTLPLIVKPAAGEPGGHHDQPEVFAHAVPALRRLAPVLAGGCCGTTEKHLAALRTAWYDAHEPPR